MGSVSIIAGHGFIFMKTFWCAVGEQSRHILLLPDKSLISLTQDQEEPPFTAEDKRTSLQTGPTELQRKLKEEVISDEEWGFKAPAILQFV